MIRAKPGRYGFAIIKKKKNDIDNHGDLLIDKFSSTFQYMQNQLFYPGEYSCISGNIPKDYYHPVLAHNTERLLTTTTTTTTLSSYREPDLSSYGEITFLPFSEIQKPEKHLQHTTINNSLSDKSSKIINSCFSTNILDKYKGMSETKI
jgi:hypothetical protein